MIYHNGEYLVLGGGGGVANISGGFNIRGEDYTTPPGFPLRALVILQQPSLGGTLARSIAFSVRGRGLIGKAVGQPVTDET